MGSSSDSSGGGDDLSHLNLLSSLVSSDGSERKPLLHSYNHAFKGFSALLTENEASILSGHDEVVSVFRDPVLHLHTTRSWDFLEAVDARMHRSRHPHKQKSVDVIIGIIDTGIWPESPSFNDHQMGKIPSKWKGVCMEGLDFNKTNCNRKLIGARVYSDEETRPTPAQGSPRDFLGHGTHTASTAGGAPVADANYYGLARGTARGGLPSARIASYKACHEEGCSGSALLKAIDDAVKDGVDIISISIGTTFENDFLSDPIAIGAFHAEQKGVMVVCSAGNSGPQPYTIVNTSPWIFTVAASTIDRVFHSTILLGNNNSYKGTAINFSPLKPDQRYPLALGERVAAEFTSASDARNCIPGSLDPKKVAGKIVVCMNEDTSVSRRIKQLVVQDAGGKGAILMQRGGGHINPYDSGAFPFVEVGQDIGSQILHYINSTRNPSATILASREVRGFKPAPIVAPFSSRGPGSLTENIIKPDVMAPGVDILAAVVPRIMPEYTAPGNKTSIFAIRSGTSMACPHVSGAAAFVKSVHPHWTSSVIKSALMTTATISNNIGKTTTNTSHFSTNPHEAGAGEIRPIKALDPGLAFATTINDHLRFLCHFGYSQKNIRKMTNKTKFTCPKNSKDELISNINYPSISVASLRRGDGPRRVKRVATNVGHSPNATYVASVNAPRGLVVKVVPREIVFERGVKKASFKVVFDGKKATKGYKYGDVSWCDGLHVVHVVFAVNVV
ncbi:hypothetical protein C2S52_004791 [Perilla frutescens var. hirtella]|nr:hypothetical protein C2S52_004791 [Perilla frutescens var. hirtella]